LPGRSSVRSCRVHVVGNAVVGEEGRICRIGETPAQPLVLREQLISFTTQPTSAGGAGPHHREAERTDQGDGQPRYHDPVRVHALGMAESVHVDRYVAVLHDQHECGSNRNG